MRIEEALSKFASQLNADGRSTHTIRQYQRHVRRLATWAAGNDHSGDVTDLTHEDLASFLSSSEARLRPDGKPKKSSSMNGLRSSLRGFFRYAHRAGYIEADPSRLVRRAQCGTPPPSTLSAEEQAKLLEALSQSNDVRDRRDSALIQLLLGTGLRLGSVVALNVEDIDLERAEIRVRKTKGDQPERVITGQRTTDVLRDFVGDRKSGSLFRSRGEDRISTRQVQRRLNHWLREAGIDRPVSAHSLRHSFATDLYRKTGDVLLVKEALRHRSITSTLVYVRFDENRLRRALA
ncbi:MAG: tyrosine-type recombinase/integrase [Planctomycetota bacterium]